MINIPYWLIILYIFVVVIQLIFFVKY